jgi:hypothetical protein
MDLSKIIKKSWLMLWQYRALWLFGAVAVWRMSREEF